MEKIFIQNVDGDGDLFVRGCNQYVPERRRENIIDHLKQLMKNYESVYGKVPTNEELKDAIKFSGLFLAEIGEVYGGTMESHYACIIGSFIDENSIVNTCTNIADIPTDTYLEKKQYRLNKQIAEQRREKRIQLQ